MLEPSGNFHILFRTIMTKSEVQSLMREAIAKAQEGGSSYGALIFNADRQSWIAEANSVRADNDPTAHAEINAIREAARLGWRGEELWLVSTCEPCPMCAMAAVWMGIKRISYGARIEDAARYGKQVHLSCAEIAAKAWFPIEVEPDILRADCVALFSRKS